MRVVRKPTDYADNAFFNVRYDPNDQRTCLQDGIMKRTKGVGLVVSSLATKTWSAVAYLVLGQIKAKAHDDEEICSSRSRNYVTTVNINVPTADVYTTKKFATVEDFALLHEDKIYSKTPWPIKGVLRIHQYLQHEHYALWEVIEFGDSYKAPLEETAKDKGLAGKVSSSTKKKRRTVAITAKDMHKRKNNVKARTTLLLALPDEHQLRFNKYDSAKELWKAMLKTFGGNEATKKTKKNQLKQQYGNFKAEGSTTLEQTFNRLHAIVQKRAGSNSQNMAFISSSNNSSGKSEVSTVQGASTASAQVPTVSTDVAAASLSYDTVCAFIATQPNESKIKYKDISHIDDDDIKEMYIKWNLVLLSIRADRQREESESYKKDPKVEEPAPKAMISIDGTGWDWSYMAEEDEASKNHAFVANKEEVPTEYALMAKSSSSSDNDVYDDSFCSKSCRKNTENLNTKISKLNEELSDCETDLYNYKRGLSQVEARLVEFKENEIKYCDKIRVLERYIEFKDNKIEYLRNKLEEVKNEKESIDFKIENFENALKDLDRLLGSQKVDKDMKDVGFNKPFTTASLSVATASLSVATASTCVSSAVATASESFPTAAIFATGSVASPTTKVTRSSRGVVIGSSSPISVNIPSISKKDKRKGKMTKP
nr:ribonuclease H-like domain-containing protein [Tanacetum cinerariifolium]